MTLKFSSSSITLFVAIVLASSFAFAENKEEEEIPMPVHTPPPQQKQDAQVRKPASRPGVQAADTVTSKQKPGNVKIKILPLKSIKEMAK